MPSTPQKHETLLDPALQFPEIEKLIQTEDFNKINRSFSSAYEELEKVGKGRSGMGKSKEAKKAMKAIERVMDLLRDLLKLKYQLTESEASTPQNRQNQKTKETK